MSAMTSKRKRDVTDQPPPNPAPQTDFVALLRGDGGGSGDMDLAQALQQHNKDQMQVQSGEVNEGDLATHHSAFDMAGAAPGSTEHAFDLEAASAPPHHDYGTTLDYDGPGPRADKEQTHAQHDGSGAITAGGEQHQGGDAGHGGTEHDPAAGAEAVGEGNASAQATPTGAPSNRRASKAKVGTEEWHASRRLAHKDVERRRREMINDGITDLAKMVPGAERNKGSILQRAVAYIAELRERMATIEEKSGLAKMMFEQTVGELNATADRLAADVRRLEAENERLRKGGSGAAAAK